MTGNQALLSEFEEKAGPVVSYGDGNIGRTLGYGCIEVGNVIIDNVALVEGLKHNLLSVSQLTDRGFQVNFLNSHCEVKDKASGSVVLRGVRTNNLYEASLDENNKGPITCLIGKTSPDESWNWHKKLCHLNFGSINELAKKELVRGLPNLKYEPEGLCDACQKTKQRRSSFKSKTEFSIEKPYHLLHLDLFGPVNIMSMGKKKYTLVIVDEFSRYTWVYFLHKKAETADIIKKHITQIEKESEFKVKILRSDNGTEFKNYEMEEFCTEKGIKQTFSAPGTPQQNGVVERKNRTLIEADMPMLEEAKLPTYFWAEAINTACFTQNCSLITKQGKPLMNW